MALVTRPAPLAINELSNAMNWTWNSINTGNMRLTLIYRWINRLIQPINWKGEQIQNAKEPINTDQYRKDELTKINKLIRPITMQTCAKNQASSTENIDHPNNNEQPRTPRLNLQPPYLLFGS